MASGGLQEGSLSGRQSEKSPVTAAESFLTQKGTRYLDRGAAESRNLSKKNGLKVVKCSEASKAIEQRERQTCTQEQLYIKRNHGEYNTTESKVANR